MDRPKRIIAKERVAKRINRLYRHVYDLGGMENIYKRWILEASKSSLAPQMSIALLRATGIGIFLRSSR